MGINLLVNTTTGTEQSQSNSFQTVRVLAFIDSSLTDYQSLMAGTLPGVEAILLEADRDGVEQITEVLRDRPDVTTVHLVSHGAPGCLYLGNSQLSLDTLADYASQLKGWFNHDSTLLIYGCNVAAGDAGEELLTKLHQLTGATVMASAKRTGNVALGGDWELEVTVPQSKLRNAKSKIPLAFRDETVASYQSVLAQDLVPFLVKDINPGSSSSGLSELTDANGTLFFRTYDSFLSIEKLWKSDGTEAGTTDISSAYFDLSYSSVFNLTNVNGILYFTAVTGTFGFLYSQLWSIDGTTVERFLDFPPDYFPDNLTEVEYTLFFTVHDFTGIDSPKLFAGTLLVGDIYSGSGDAHVSNLTDVNGLTFHGISEKHSGKAL
jgi:ELWxxDGT repeat protein